MPYWELLEDDLNNYPIRLDLVKSHIIQLTKIIYNIIPKEVVLLENIEKNINIINTDTDSYYIITSMNYLFTIAKKIQSHIHINNTDKYHKIVKNSMIEGDELKYFIPKTIKYLTKLFYNIWDDKIDIKAAFTKWKYMK